MPGLRNALMVGLAVIGGAAVEQQAFPELPLFSIGEQALLSVGQQAVDAFNTTTTVLGLADDPKANILHADGKTIAEVSSVGDIGRKTLEDEALILGLISGIGYKAGWRVSIRRQKPKSE